MNTEFFTEPYRSSTLQSLERPSVLNHLSRNTAADIAMNHRSMALNSELPRYTLFSCRTINL